MSVEVKRKKTPPIEKVTMESKYKHKVQAVRMQDGDIQFAFINHLDRTSSANAGLSAANPFSTEDAREFAETVIKICDEIEGKA